MMDLTATFSSSYSNKMTFSAGEASFSKEESIASSKEITFTAREGVQVTLSEKSQNVSAQSIPQTPISPPVAGSQKQTTAETADNIVGSVKQKLEDSQKEGADRKELRSILKDARRGFRQGFREAVKTLRHNGNMDKNLKGQLAETHSRVRQGFRELRQEFLPGHGHHSGPSRHSQATAVSNTSNTSLNVAAGQQASAPEPNLNKPVSSVPGTTTKANLSEPVISQPLSDKTEAVVSMVDLTTATSSGFSVQASAPPLTAVAAEAEIATVTADTDVATESASTQLDPVVATTENTVELAPSPVSSSTTSASETSRQNSSFSENYAQTVRETISNIDTLSSTYTGQPGGQMENTQSAIIEITTQDGDRVAIDIAAMFQATASFGSGSELELSISSGNDSNFIVEGELDADELVALTDLLSQIDELAVEFFGGDVATAYQEAQSLGFDGSELAGFSLSFNQSTNLTATRSYLENQDAEDTSAQAARQSRFSQLSDYVSGMQKALDSAAGFSNSANMLSSLLNHSTDANTALNSAISATDKQEFNQLNDSLLAGLVEIQDNEAAQTL